MVCGFKVVPDFVHPQYEPKAFAGWELEVQPAAVCSVFSLGLPEAEASTEWGQGPHAKHPVASRVLGCQAAWQVGYNQDKGTNPVAPVATMVIA